MVEVITAIICGILQGIAEWLPISSSGQTVLILLNFFGVEPQKAFSLAVYLHIGTMLAVIVKFRDEIKAIMHIREDSKPLIRFLLTSTLITGFFGAPTFIFMRIKMSSLTGELATAAIGFLLLLTGITLHLTRKHVKTKNEPNDIDAFLAGTAQAFSILPGISRSGFTVGTLLLRGLSEEKALQLSFLMSLPAVLGYVLLDLLVATFPPPPTIFAGILSSFLFGYLTIEFMLALSRTLRFDLFCIFFGIIAIASALLSVIGMVNIYVG